MNSIMQSDPIMANKFGNIGVDLIEKYNVSGPYYTSYPTLSEWSDKFSGQDYISALKELCADKRDTPLFLYIHFPFCAKRCYFCACNSIPSYDHASVQKYLAYLSQEIDLFHDFFEKHSFVQKFKMIHLGGGSPNLMSKEEFDSLITKLQPLVDFKDLDEFTIEVDPRTVDKEKLKYFSEKGIDRLSFGIQDFDPRVQKAINRIQPIEMVDQLLSPEVRSCFKSINFDLVYGLPLQSRESFRKTVETVKGLSPDRITLLKYAHIPESRKHQRLIRESDLPDYVEGQMMFIEAVNNFLDSGYEYTGIDHFSKPTDSLAKAKRTKTVWRNSIGFTPGGPHNLIGIGPTGTSSFNNYYAQNVYTLPEYYEALDNTKFPTLRGFKLNRDDLIRREIINEILCNSRLDFADIEEKYSIDFNEYFKEEINLLKDFVQDNILIFSNNSIEVTLPGRIFIRHICKVFDKYSRSKIYKISGP